MRTEPRPLDVGLAILARRARLGRGKTRLAATVGPVGALQIYRHLVTRTAAAARDSRLPTTVYFDPAPGDEDLWPAQQFASAVQPSGADLGERIACALASVRGDGALVIGTDCPTLTGEVLAQAAEALADHDAVLGPTLDGGFYLLGVRRLTPDLFDGVAWSTEAVAGQMRAAFGRLGWTYAELPTLRDVDTEADWDAYRASLPSPTT